MKNDHKGTRKRRPQGEKWGVELDLSKRQGLHKKNEEFLIVALSCLSRSVWQTAKQVYESNFNMDYMAGGKRKIPTQQQVYRTLSYLLRDNKIEVSKNEFEVLTFRKL